jgi:hypothetical protein
VNVWILETSSDEGDEEEEVHLQDAPNFVTAAAPVYYDNINSFDVGSGSALCTLLQLSKS